MNIWYVVAKEDPKKEYGFTQITKKGDYFKSFEEANEERIYLQSDFKERLVVLKRTCEVIN